MAIKILLKLTTMLADNHLSFIETSALDASNVELAFQNILTGMCYMVLNCSGSTFLFGIAKLELTPDPFPQKSTKLSPLKLSTKTNRLPKSVTGEGYSKSASKQIPQRTTENAAKF